MRRIENRQDPAGITPSEAAVELAGISERTVRDIEKGKESPNFAAYAALAHVGGMRIELAGVEPDGR